MAREMSPQELRDVLILALSAADQLYLRDVGIKIDSALVALEEHATPPVPEEE